MLTEYLFWYVKQWFSKNTHNAQQDVHCFKGKGMYCLLLAKTPVG